MKLSLSVLPIVTVALAGFAAPAESQRQRRGEQMLQEQFDVGAGGSLVVDVPDGDIDIETSAGSGVEVAVFVYSRDMESALEVFESMEFQATAQGNTVTVRARRARRRRSRNSWWGGDGVSITVQVRIPTRFNAEIATDDGDVFITDLQGTLRVDTSDGDVELGTVRGDEIWIETSDGDVMADALESARTSIRTNDGDVDVRAVTGPFGATTGDGDIYVRLEGAPGDVNLRTGDGDITINAAATLAATVDFDAEDLNLSREFAISGRVARRRVRGDLNGGGPRLEASTGDGTISLRPIRTRR